LGECLLNSVSHLKSQPPEGGVWDGTPSGSPTSPALRAPSPQERGKGKGFKGRVFVGFK